MTITDIMWTLCKQWIPVVPHSLMRKVLLPHCTHEVLTGEVTLPMSHVYRVLKHCLWLTATKRPMQGTLATEGRVTAMWEKQESKAYCIIAITMSPSLAPGNRAGHLSLRTNRPKKGADFLTSPQQTISQQCHYSKNKKASVMNYHCRAASEWGSAQE